jgi:hypothetical protein
MEKPNNPKKPTTSKKAVKSVSEHELKVEKETGPKVTPPADVQEPAKTVSTAHIESVKPPIKTAEQIEKEHNALLNKQIKRRSFIAFGTFAVLSATAIGSWRWLLKSPLEVKGITAGAQAPLRRALNRTELFFRNLFSNSHLVRTYPKEMAAKNVRVNSNEGLHGAFDPKSWVLEVKKKSGDVLKVTLEELRTLPKTEIVYDFKCVEGWDQISYWGGVKFSDFVDHFKLHDEVKLQYAGMETPNK